MIEPTLLLPRAESYHFLPAFEHPAPRVRFIAQQVLAIFPNLVSTTSATALTPGGTLSLN